MTSRGFFALLLSFAAVSAAAVPKPDRCPEEKKNHFSGAVVTPGATASALAAKLARVNDYGNHPTGWLVERLFPLEDDFEITGELVTDPACIIHVSQDDDREFYVKLSDDSIRKLSSYISPASAVPQYILVEMVASFSNASGDIPFKSWDAKSANRVQFGIDNTAFRPFAVSGEGNDWDFLRSKARRYVAVRGALVVDISEFHAGTGDLEIHPGEFVRVGNTPQTTTRGLASSLQ